MLWLYKETRQSSSRQEEIICQLACGNAGQKIQTYGLRQCVQRKQKHFKSEVLTLDFNFQVLRASLVAQLVKNPPAMQETWIRSLGWEDPLEKGKATHSSILAWRIP